jgi:HD-GYP domain-containing protein (c-di-GMP phosphodiesterase class II)
MGPPPSRCCGQSLSGEGPLSPSSAAHARAYIANLRAFYGWAKSRGHIAVDPSAELSSCCGRGGTSERLPLCTRAAFGAAQSGCIGADKVYVAVKLGDEIRESRVDLRWRPRRLAAAALRAFVLVTPIAIAFVAATVAGHIVPPPDRGYGLWVWRVAILAVATVVSLAVERRLRVVASLSTLLKLSLVFPDHAPPRYAIALRTGTSRQLRERLREAQTSGRSDVDQGAGARLLELVGALNVHDRLTRGHSERVRAYARLIGEELQLGAGELDRLNWAVLLHDIGKLEIPEEVLTSPRALTEAQWVLMHRHPEAGARLSAPLQNWLGDWGDAVLHHHERWDGCGYPSGLAGTDISLAGRIAAVADSFDVMTSARSYKQPCSPAAAREELSRCAGTQFDPSIVRAFLNVSLGRLRMLVGPLSWLTQVPPAQPDPRGRSRRERCLRAAHGHRARRGRAAWHRPGRGPRRARCDRDKQSGAQRSARRSALRW